MLRKTTYSVGMRAHPRHVRLLTAAAPAPGDVAGAVARARLIGGCEADVSATITALLLGGERPTWERFRAATDVVQRALPAPRGDPYHTAFLFKAGKHFADASHVFRFRGWAWRHSRQPAVLQTKQGIYSAAYRGWLGLEPQPSMILSAAMLHDESDVISDFSAALRTVKIDTLHDALQQRHERHDALLALCALAPHSAPARRIVKRRGPESVAACLTDMPCFGVHVIHSGDIALRRHVEQQCRAGQIGAIMIVAALGARGDDAALALLRQTPLNRLWQTAQTRFSTEDARMWWPSLLDLFRATHLVECLTGQKPEGVKNPLSQWNLAQLHMKAADASSSKYHLAAVTLAFLSAYDMEKPEKA